VIGCLLVPNLPGHLGGGIGLKGAVFLAKGPLGGGIGLLKREREKSLCVVSTSEYLLYFRKRRSRVMEGPRTGSDGL